MKWWECPVCGWRIDDVAYLTIRIDEDCPGCGSRTLSQFEFREQPDEAEAR